MHPWCAGWTANPASSRRRAPGRPAQPALPEVVRLGKIAEGDEQPSDVELNIWIAGFPVEPLGDW
jgi:hypothetical protein